MNLKRISFTLALVMVLTMIFGSLYTINAEAQGFQRLIVTDGPIENKDTYKVTFKNPNSYVDIRVKAEVWYRGALVTLDTMIIELK